MKCNAILLWLGVSISVVNSAPLNYATRDPATSIAKSTATPNNIYSKRHHSVDNLYERDIEERNYEFEEHEGDLQNLEERNDNHLEPRFIAALIRIGEKIGEGIAKAVKRIKGILEGDKKARSRFTFNFLSRLRARFPRFNFVICHTAHVARFKGKEGKDWGHLHREFKVHFGKTIGYEIYWGKEGEFRRKGDGGFLNWAYLGNAKVSGGGKRDRSSVAARSGD